MKSRCKVNDLAFIKKSIRPSNIGKVVQCKELLGKFERDEVFAWNGESFISTDTDYIWVVTSKSQLETLYGPSSEALIADSWLIPIRGEPSENLEEELAEDLGKELVY
jgi:hypothetical protein